MTPPDHGLKNLRFVHFIIDSLSETRGTAREPPQRPVRGGSNSTCRNHARAGR
jgi:hypothetical protein